MTCSHPWYLEFKRGPVWFRQNLDKLIGRHAEDLTEAKAEAQRAIAALLAKRDPRGIVPEDDVTVRTFLAAYLPEKLSGLLDRITAETLLDSDKAALWQVRKIVATELRDPSGTARAFGDWRLSELSPETLKAFRRARPRVAGARDLAFLKHAFNVAVLDGLLPRSPFRIGDVPAVKLPAEPGRTRRLHPGEEARLMAHARGLADLITGALEAGLRRGELLSLQWHQVRFAPRCELFLPAQKTKAKKDRRIPISSVLERVLRRRRHDPAGELLPPDAFVFGDEVGRRRGSIKSAWRFLCQRAGIDGLHFHDLRREAGSRWMDAGVPLATIQRWLGHHNISQTSTYLGASLGGDEQDMRAFEQRIGRVPELQQNATNASAVDQKRASSSRAMREIPRKSAKVRDRQETIH